MTVIQNRKIIIIAGPNGAGKTTFAQEFLPNEAGCPVFNNADLIAAGLAPFDQERAAFKAERNGVRLSYLGNLFTIISNNESLTPYFRIAGLSGCFQLDGL